MNPASKVLGAKYAPASSIAWKKRPNAALSQAVACTKVRTGSVLYDAQVPGTNNDYLAYAVLRTKATGHEFMFTATHLEPSSGTVMLSYERAGEVEVGYMGPEPE